MSTYKSFIGLEIHIQLNTKSKVFCSCKTSFGDEANTNVCPVCMGYPGTLPALNQEAIRKGYAVAKALHCNLAERCHFERKNYFYPDLPKNYQISQFAAPLGTEGWIEIDYQNQRKRIRIKECHLEEDAGKMIHAGDMSLLDYNRTGTPLLEIVTEPDLEFGDEAEILLHELRRLVRYLGVCDGNMEEGSMRCDANVSINLAGQGLGRKVEVKNLNSSRFVRKAIVHELERQAQILDKGAIVLQETRLWNENRDQTETMRSKESAHDYRYFTEPDLPPFSPDKEFLASLDKILTELPLDRKDRMSKAYGLSAAQADFIAEERPFADYFEQTVKLGADATNVAAWLCGDVQKVVNRENVAVYESKLSANRFASLIKLLDKGTISGKIAKQVLDLVFDEDKDPEVLVKEKGLEQLTDRKTIRGLVDQVLANNSKAVAQIREGDQKPLGFLAGQVLKESGGKADPRIVQEILTEVFSLK